MSVMILSPLPVGMTAATEVRFYGTRARDTEPTVAPAMQDAEGTWSVDTSGLEGRYWPTVVGTDAAGGEVTSELGYVDLPMDESLIVSPEALASRAGIALPLTPEQRESIVEAIEDAQSDVIAYLGRAILPTRFVEEHVWSWGDDEWNLTAHGDDDVIRVESAVPEYLDDGVTVSGYYTVTYWAGLDSRNNPSLRPISRYVRAHALNSPEFVRLWQDTSGVRGEVRSVSAEGQSVSFGPVTLGGGGEAGSGKPGALPTLASLDRWRVAGRRVYQAPTRYGTRGRW